jgi:hypothetical protein
MVCSAHGQELAHHRGRGGELARVPLLGFLPDVTICNELHVFLPTFNSLTNGETFAERDSQDLSSYARVEKVENFGKNFGFLASFGVQKKEMSETCENRTDFKAIHRSATVTISASF